MRGLAIIIVVVSHIYVLCLGNKPIYNVLISEAFI